MTLTEQINEEAINAFPTATPLGRGYVAPNSGAGEPDSQPLSFDHHSNVLKADVSLEPGAFGRGYTEKEFATVVTEYPDIYAGEQSTEVLEKYKQLSEVRVIKETDEGATLGPANPPHPVEELVKRLAESDDYAWSWACVLACSAMDEGVDQASANKIAYRFLHALSGGKVDITKNTLYSDLLASIANRPKPEIEYVDPDTNHVYVSVRGFAPGSGATALAVQLQRALDKHGYSTTLSAEVADLELPSPPTKTTLVSITAHENDGHSCTGNTAVEGSLETALVIN